MKTRTWAAAALLGLAGLTAGPAAAGRADPLTPAVEGDANFDQTFYPSSNASEIVWECSALTTGAVAASTGVTCVLTVEGVEVDSVSSALPGSAVVTAPRRVSAIGGAVEVCWTAQALLSTDELITDTTLPNCKG